MARRSLRPELNRIRAWVRQGRTDAWIAHQLEVTVQQIQAFKREQGLEPNGDPEAGVGVDFDDEIDLRAEDDALIAAELEAAEAQRAEQEDEEADSDEDEDDDGEEKRGAAKRRRGRRGGRRGGTRRKTSALEATFDHGEEGYGLWLDASVQDDPIYAEYWAGHRPVEVTIEEDQIVIRRVGDDDADDNGDGDGDGE
ncbi:MAG TPA: hypothetical protein VFH80_35490 [Solirubrobacteraceae bacterium]|nr:hypothetical protein [Solirubrobacteraceae bacterium]